MKFFISVIFIFLFTVGVVMAKSDKLSMPVIKFNGSKYTLMYSAKSSETGGYLNEYYKSNQTYASWNELIGVHHYPSAYYPIEHAKEFAEYLTGSGIVANTEIDDEKNSAILYFVVMDKSKLPIIMEFNVFKYTKSSVCGTIGLQYAKRYRLSSPLEIEKTKKEIVKSGPKYINKLSKLKTPEVITMNADNGQYSLKEGCNDDMVNLD